MLTMGAIPSETSKKSAYHHVPMWSVIEVLRDCFRPKADLSPMSVNKPLKTTRKSGERLGRRDEGRRRKSSSGKFARASSMPW